MFLNKLLMSLLPFDQGLQWDMLIFDLTNVSSCKQAKRMCRELSMLVDKPIVLVGNKDDLPKEVHDIAFHKQYKVQLFSVSAVEKTDVEKPFQYLARFIMKKPSLTFTAIAADGGENIAANPDEANANAENDNETTVNAHSANDSNVNANPDAADSILSNPTGTASTPKTPTNNTRDFAGDSLASAGVLETTPGRSTRCRQQILRISGKDEGPNFIRINGKDEVPNFINNETPTCAEEVPKPTTKEFLFFTLFTPLKNFSPETQNQ
ncbi:hypothetical protein C5167_020123, partial [Papaver somniferum]